MVSSVGNSGVRKAICSGRMAENCPQEALERGASGNPDSVRNGSPVAASVRLPHSRRGTGLALSPRIVRRMTSNSSLQRP